MAKLIKKLFAYLLPHYGCTARRMLNANKMATTAKLHKSFLPTFFQKSNGKTNFVFSIDFDT